jgi:hypothetical protein
MGVDSGRQALNVPATQTLVAVEWVNSRWTDGDAVPPSVGLFLLFLLIALGFAGFEDW